MTLDDLRDRVWDSLPPLRKRLAGRASVDALVTMAVKHWEGEFLSACRGADEQGLYVRTFARKLERLCHARSGKGPQEFGFIWMFLLQAVAVAAIQWLVNWWLERNVHRVLMAGWQQELT